MKKMQLALVVALAMPLIAACGKKEEGGAGATKSAETDKAKANATASDPGAAPKAGPAQFAAWDMAARKAAWTGAWAGEGHSLGNAAAWHVDGTKVTFVDKSGEKTYELDVNSPCTAKFVEKSASGSSSVTSVYTVKDGQLITGLGSAGSRNGDKAIVCGSGKIFALEGATCTEIQDNFGRWENKPGECGIRTNDKGGEEFWFKAHGRETVLPIEADVILSEQLARSHATKHPDLAAAKAAQKL